MLPKPQNETEVMPIILFMTTASKLDCINASHRIT